MENNNQTRGRSRAHKRHNSMENQKNVLMIMTYLWVIAVKTLEKHDKPCLKIYFMIKSNC
jgi:hypothetical protein